MRRLGAGCQAPVGALGRVDGGDVVLEAAIPSPGGVARTRISGGVGAPDVVGTLAAEDLLCQLGLGSLREADWAGLPPGRPGAYP